MSRHALNFVVIFDKNDNYPGFTPFLLLSKLYSILKIVRKGFSVQLF